jgi:hypothetical protein
MAMPESARVMLLADHDRRAPKPVALMTCAARQSARGRGETRDHAGAHALSAGAGTDLDTGRLRHLRHALVGAPCELAPAVR